MASIKLLVGTTYGNAQQAAEDAAELLKEQGHTAEVFSRPTLEDIADPDVLLVCTATIGVGDIPDCLVPLYNQLSNEPPKLDGVRFGVIALGDSSYDTFASAGEQMREVLLDLGCAELQPMLVVDAIETPDPEDAVAEWIDQLGPVLAA